MGKQKPGAIGGQSTRKDGYVTGPQRKTLMQIMSPNGDRREGSGFL